MKTLSVRQPWAAAIIHGVRFFPNSGRPERRLYKPVENRTWRPADELFGTRIRVQASKTVDTEEFDHFAEWTLANWGRVDLEDPNFKVLGAVIGEVTLKGVRRIVTASQFREARFALGDETMIWSFGPYLWLLADPEAYAEPIPCRGRLGLFDT